VPFVTPKRLVPALALICLAGYVFVYATGRAGPPIRSDGFSYYVYLPAWFIYGDPTLSAVADDCCGGEFPEFTAIIRWPGTGRWVNAHPIGVALMQAPLFLVSDALSRWTNLSRDGFTLYYQHAVGLSGLVWVVCGLWVLGGLLRRHFSDRVTMATLVALLFGTNLYHYATFDSFYSHPYSFFLVSALLELTERWHTSPTRRDTRLLGLVCGLIILTRHTNILLLAIIPLYTIGAHGLAGAISLVQQRRHDLLVVVLIAAGVVSPQLALYYAATGRPIVSSYGTLGFDFGSPHLYGVLFSVQKGLFFWSPLLLVAVAGLLMLRGRARVFLLPAIVVLAADTYLIASWWDWQFGASYGHRGFIDLFPLLAPGLATVFEWSAQRRGRRVAVTVATGLAVALSVVQMLQYWNGILPVSDTTWAQYRAMFLQLR
jgi:hypothetical protein